MIQFVLIIFVFLSCTSQERQNEDFAEFESKSLPLTFLTEDYSVYDFFEMKDTWNPVQDGFVNEGCSSKIGFSIRKEDKFQAVIYPEKCGEESLAFYLATVDEKGRIISKLVILSLIDDIKSINSYLNENLSEIKVVNRTFVKNDNPKALIKTLENEDYYSVAQDGKIDRGRSIENVVRYYKMDSKGTYIILE